MKKNTLNLMVFLGWIRLLVNLLIRTRIKLNLNLNCIKIVGFDSLIHICYGSNKYLF